MYARGMDSAQFFAVATRRTDERMEAVDGRQAAESSLVSRDRYLKKTTADLLKVGKKRNASVVKLDEECVKLDKECVKSSE